MRIYHNPRCSKSRQTLALLQEAGVEPEVVEYLKTPPSAQELGQVHAALGGDVRAMLRFKEERARELGLRPDDERDTGEWLRLLAENPQLLERPIVVSAGAARSASVSARRAVGMQVPVEEQTIEEQVCEMCPTMTFKQRLIALICCCVLGYILEICGTLTLIGGPTARNIRKFSVLYVCGNLIAIMATAFWVGPKLMCKKMWNSTRRGATAMYLVSLVLVLVLALLHVAVFVVLLMLAVELFCAVWYSASYVPKGRWCVVQCCKNTLFSPCPEVLDPVQASLPTV